MAGDVHNMLVALGARWLKKEGFGVVATELVVAGITEQADVIGFRSNCSALIEAKASRSDFLVDHRKPHRVAGGLGVYRFYLCPAGVIQAEELPSGWGLLYADGKRVVDVIRPTGNMWPQYGVKTGDWAKFQHAPNAEAERRVLYSIARRQKAA